MNAFFGHTFALTSSGVAVEIQLVLDASLMAMTPTILAPAIRFSLFVLGEVDQWERDKSFPVLNEPVLAHDSESWRRSASKQQLHLLSDNKQQLHLLSDNKRSSQLSHAAIA